VIKYLNIALQTLYSYNIMHSLPCR